MTKYLLFLFITSLLAQGQTDQKLNPNNPGVTISDNYKPEDWRTLSENGKYLEAASELLYLVQSDSTRNFHADYWHIGQIYADAGQYDKAIFYMDKSVQGMTEEEDKQYWWYYKGTTAFLKRDKEQLKKYEQLLEKNHTNYYSNNSKVLNRLLKYFDKSYREVIRMQS